jgi:hypothetical protein
VSGRGQDNLDGEEKGDKGVGAMLLPLLQAFKKLIVQGFGTPLNIDALNLRAGSRIAEKSGKFSAGFFPRGTVPPLF